MKKIIVVGATSGIGLEVVKIYIERGWMVGVAGRRVAELEKIRRMAPSQVCIQPLDVTAADASDALLGLVEKLDGMDVFLLSAGVGAQNALLEPQIEINTACTNVVGFTRMVTAAYNYFAGRNRGGHIAVISSVAGTKGLGIAPAYSATKRFQNTYIQALQQHACITHKQIAFTDIRPGFVATDLLKDRNYPMLMQAPAVAEKIVSAIDQRRRSVVIDWRYRILVALWRLIPGWLWVKLPVK